VIKDELIDKFKNLKNAEQILMQDVKPFNDTFKISLKSEDVFDSVYGFSVDKNSKLHMYCKVKIGIQQIAYTRFVSIQKEVVDPEPILTMYEMVISVAKEANAVLELIRQKYIGKSIKMDDEADVTFTIHTVDPVGTQIHFTDTEGMDRVNSELCTIND
jgi:hypothetical protein